MKKQLLGSVLLVSAMMLGATVQAADPAAGKAKSQICATCHGAEGMATIKTYPNLAGQNEAYLYNALVAYKNKQRNGGMAVVMQAQAANLSDQDMKDLAAYYASLK